jgi:hypothetical protein
MGPLPVWINSVAAGISRSKTAGLFAGFVSARSEARRRRWHVVVVGLADFHAVSPCALKPEKTYHARPRQKSKPKKGSKMKRLSSAEMLDEMNNVGAALDVAKEQLSFLPPNTARIPIVLIGEAQTSLAKLCAGLSLLKTDLESLRSRAAIEDPKPFGLEPSPPDYPDSHDDVEREEDEDDDEEQGDGKTVEGFAFEHGIPTSLVWECTLFGWVHVTNQLVGITQGCPLPSLAELGAFLKTAYSERPETLGWIVSTVHFAIMPKWVGVDEEARLELLTRVFRDSFLHPPHLAMGSTDTD